MFTEKQLKILKDAIQSQINRLEEKLHRVELINEYSSTSIDYDFGDKQYLIELKTLDKELDQQILLSS